MLVPEGGSVAYKDGFHSADLLGVLRRRQVIGFDAHSKFLRDPSLFAKIHAMDWDPGIVRPMRANFLGSRDPAIRTRILDSVHRYFTSFRASPAGDASPKKMYWHAYSDSQPAALGPAEFLDILQASDFTLAPPGYSLVTHRPIEALLRGSIPVLNAKRARHLRHGLVDGRPASPPPRPLADGDGTDPGDAREQVSAMRRKVRLLVAKKVSYAALSRDISRRLGLASA